HLISMPLKSASSRVGEPSGTSMSRLWAPSRSPLSAKAFASARALSCLAAGRDEDPDHRDADHGADADELADARARALGHRGRSDARRALEGAERDRR